jgi:hypothetical protein
LRSEANRPPRPPQAVVSRARSTFAMRIAHGCGYAEPITGEHRP